METQVECLRLEGRRAVVQPEGPVARVSAKAVPALRGVEILVIPPDVDAFYGLNRFENLRIVEYGGTADVFATPFMIALMEYAALTLVQPHLPEGIITLGTMVNITHTSPTLEGMTVRAQAELLETDGRRFLFRVTAWDDAGLIGEGTHERHTVKTDRFLEKAAARRAGSNR